jgi:hypothetical protein
VTSDTWRLHYTYLIAILVLLGAWAMLFMPTPDITGGEKLNFAIFVSGIVLGFVFNRESSVSGARSAERQIEQGAQGGVRTSTLEDTAKANALNGAAEPNKLVDLEHREERP